MANIDYCVMYRKKDSKQLFKIIVPLPNIKAVAKYLNGFVKRNTDSEVLVVFIVDSKGEHQKNTRFLPSEYAGQQWLTGYKERLLAYAKEECGMVDLKWNSSIKEKI